MAESRPVADSRLGGNRPVVDLVVRNRLVVVNNRSVVDSLAVDNRPVEGSLVVGPAADSLVVGSHLVVVLPAQAQAPDTVALLRAKDCSLALRKEALEAFSKVTRRPGLGRRR